MLGLRIEIRGREGVASPLLDLKSNYTVRLYTCIILIKILT